MNDDPLMPYLLEIISQPEAEGIILAGGFGMRLKQRHLRDSNQTTLLTELPEVRATQDIDVFLNLQLWIEKERAIAYRAMLLRLGYEVAVHSWRFRKPYPDTQKRFIKLDIQARTPREGEKVNVRDGQVGKKMGTDLAGYHTPEAFAVDDLPLRLLLSYNNVNGSVLVPHPYAWLNLKVAAAYDWLREVRGERIEPKIDLETGISRRLKHVYDVYALVAMLTERELEEAADLAVRYADNSMAETIRQQAVELYSDPDGDGIRAIHNYARQSLSRPLLISHEQFWQDGLNVALGIRTNSAR
jgi:uncharacterized protein (DUF952 family)